MDSSSSDEEDSKLEFWTNCKLNRKHGTKCRGIQQPRKKFSRQVLPDFSEAAALITSTEDPRFGNWIPPLPFLNYRLKDEQNTVPKTSQKHFVKVKESLNTTENYEVTKNTEGTSEISTETSICATSWRKDINSDWGKRIQLHDVTKLNDGDMFWGIVNLAVFADIKLWVNEYGHICCSASGKILKKGSSESTQICINNSELLRKMLTISIDQWSSLCETVKATNATLKFSVFEVFNEQKSTKLEKLWFFTCKRRHYLPSQCMLVKYCGAVKCLKRFDVLPKLVVQEIRYIEEAMKKV